VNADNKNSNNLPRVDETESSNCNRGAQFSYAIIEKDPIEHFIVE